MAASADTVQRVTLWYAGATLVLFLIGVIWAPLAVATSFLVIVLSVVVMLIGPRRLESPLVTRWRWAALVVVLWWVVTATAAHWTVFLPNVAVPSTVVEVISYELSVVIALIVMPGYSRRRGGSALVDSLVAITTLVAVTGTLSVLLLARDSETSSGSRATGLVAFLMMDLVILVVLVRQYRYDHDKSGPVTWLVVAGVQTMLAATIGVLAADQLDLPGWVQSLRLVWLIGLIVLGVAALSPAQRFADSPRLSWNPASVAVVALLLVGPPLELVVPSQNYWRPITLALLICVLLVDTYRRIRSEQAIRTAAALLAGATDAVLVLSATRQAVLECTGRPRRVLVCAASPDGLRITDTGGPDLVPPASRDEPPARYVEATLVGQQHLAVQSPPSTAPVAIGVVGSTRKLERRSGVLELLAAQAGLALNRILLTAELSRKASENYFQTLVANTTDMIFTIDDQERIRYASPSARAAFGTALIGEAAVSVFGSDQVHTIRARLAAGGSSDPLHWRLTINDRRREVEVLIDDLRDNPAVHGVVVTLRDVTEERRLNRRLSHLAYHDELTGLGNLAWMADRFRHAVGERTEPVLLVVELRDFDLLNNLYGRVTGNLVLLEIARKLSGSGGEAARLDGGRFAVLQNSDRDPEALARDLHRELSGTHAVGAERVSVSAAVGAVRTTGPTGFNEALRRAGLAAADAIGDLQRPWRSYRSEMLTAALDRESLIKDLAGAIESDELTLHYQPVVDLRDGRVTGLEALARWNHPERGMISPGAFIPLAEGTGLIVPLGRWVLWRAAADAAQLYRSAQHVPRISVNVAAQQLADPTLTQQVSAAIEAADLPATTFCLEITESSVVRNAGRSPGVLHELRGLGLSLAIDDFGTGHSALSYLIDLPFDVLKIDRSFITKVAVSRRHADLVGGIARIAQAVGLTVVAEGIETEDQRVAVAAVGCDYGQGFLFSRPVPFDLIPQHWIGDYQVEKWSSEPGE